MIACVSLDMILDLNQVFQVSHKNPFRFTFELIYTFYILLIQKTSGRTFLSLYSTDALFIYSGRDNIRLS